MIFLFHYVGPAKYRRVIFDKDVDKILKEVCLEIAKRYEIELTEIGTDKDHVHFLTQSVASNSPTKIIRAAKRLTAREIFARAAQVQEQLLGGELWSEGYYVSTVGRHGSEEVVKNYVRPQGEGPHQ